MNKEYKIISKYQLIVNSFIFLPFSIFCFIFFGCYGLLLQVSSATNYKLAFALIIILSVIGIFYSVGKITEYKNGKLEINDSKMKFTKNDKTKTYNLKDIKKAKKIYNRNTNSLKLIFNNNEKLNINFLNKKQLKELCNHIENYTKVNHSLFNRIDF